jgi:hypothetical protein
MRIRTIKPEFWESETLGKVSRDARLLFIGLFNSSDDFGKSRASSRILASRLYPFDDDARALIPVWLGELEKAGCIRQFIADDVEYLWIPKWATHQKIDHPTKSKIPDFSESLANPRESSREIALDQGSGIRDQGNGTGNGNRDHTCAQGRVVEVLKYEVEDSKAKPEKKPRERNQLLDAMATVGGGKPEEVTPKAWPAAASALSEIKSVSPDVTVEEIRRRAENYKKHFRDAALTPSALAKHWARCGDWLKQSGHNTPDDLLSAF